MSTAEELAEGLDAMWIDPTLRHYKVAPGVEAAAAELRRLSSELADCKAAYESQFKELHALKASIGEPVAWLSPGRERLEFSRPDTVYGSHTIPLYAIKDKQP